VTDKDKVDYASSGVDIDLEGKAVNSLVSELNSPFCNSIDQLSTPIKKQNLPLLKSFSNLHLFWSFTKINQEVNLVGLVHRLVQ